MTIKNYYPSFRAKNNTERNDSITNSTKPSENNQKILLSLAGLATIGIITATMLKRNKGTKTISKEIEIETKATAKPKQNAQEIIAELTAQSFECFVKKQHDKVIDIQEKILAINLNNTTDNATKTKFYTDLAEQYEVFGILLEAGNNPSKYLPYCEKAIEHWKKAAEIEPQNSKYLNSIADLYEFRLGDKEKSKEYYKKLSP